MSFNMTNRAKNVKLYRKIRKGEDSMTAFELND